ncbi:hypothetical protein LJR230_001400 [Trinickia sp. LjRoot230]
MFRTLVDAGAMEAPDTITREVLDVLPELLPDDRATLLEAIISNPRCLSSAPVREAEHRTIAVIFDSIRTLPERHQPVLLHLLALNARQFSKTHELAVLQLRGPIIDATRALELKPGAVRSTARATPQPDLHEIVESLFGGVENGDRLRSLQSTSDAAAADRLAALSATASAVLELIDAGHASNDLPQALSEHLLDRILALEEPRHRFTALRLLLSAPVDAPALDAMFEEQPWPYRGEVLGFGAFIRIADAIEALPLRYQGVLLEAMVPVCIANADKSENEIMLNRILALLRGIDLEDRVVTIEKLIRCYPLRGIALAKQPSIARAIRDAVFAQGPGQPPELLKDLFDYVSSFLLGHHHKYKFVQEVIKFLNESPPEFRRIQAEKLVSASGVPSDLVGTLKSMARD